MRRWSGSAGGDRRLRWMAASALAAALVLATAAAAPAQERRPAVGSGVPLLVLPVQAVTPAPDGMMPGGPGSRTEARSRATAELDFAVSESEETSSWVSPAQITERAAKNPLLKADPVQLPVAGLDEVEAGKGRVPDPLHGQLRGLAALTDARLALIPTRLSYQAAADSASAGSAEGGGEDDDGEEARIPPPGRAVFHVTLLDVRAARVLWRGTVHGSAAPAESSAAVATAAANLVSYFSP